LQRSDGNLARQDGSEIGIRLDVGEFHRLIKPIMRAPSGIASPCKPSGQRLPTLNVGVQSFIDHNIRYSVNVSDIILK
jgi:hypothetical protein